MNQFLRMSLMAGLLISTVACSTVPVQHTSEFVKADTNGDSRISLPEWLRTGGAEASFIAADTAKAGQLDEGQFRQALRFNDEATGGGAERKRKVLDTQISSEAKAILEGSREINGRGIKVEVYQGNVTLSGSVRSQKEKQAAENLIGQVTGVNAVFNQLIIKQ